MQVGHTTLYPNNYIILVGPSANARKGEAINIAQAFAKAANISMAADTQTPESLIRDIASMREEFVDNDGVTSVQSAITAYVGELAVFTGQQNDKFLVTLTDWYDSRGVWEYKTKNQGRDEIQGMCFNLLGATAPDWISYIFTPQAIGGGFTSRCIFVCETRKRATVPDPNAHPPDLKLYDALCYDLEAIRTRVKGRYDWTPEAKTAYEAWYVASQEELDRTQVFMGDGRLAGYGGRRQSHIRKISMAMAASTRDDLIVELDDFERARLLLERTESKLGNLFAGIGHGRYVAETDKVLNYLRTHREVTRHQLLRNLYRDLDEASLKAITEILREMHVLDVKVDSDGIMWFVYRGD
jgi:hypothetical protein